jgi:hypothetical protein
MFELNFVNFISETASDKFYSVVFDNKLFYASVEKITGLIKFNSYADYADQLRIEKILTDYLTN